jgi:hypothetical protein
MALSQEEVDRLITEAREDVRAKCEAKLREMSKSSEEMYEKVVLRTAANAIAALKGNGEGK